MTGDLVGTYRYMSPEQALAKRVPLDHRTDIYSLGATLYELLTLRPAVPGTDREEILRQIAFEEPAAPRRINPKIPVELETILLKALAKNPAGALRPASGLRRRPPRLPHGPADPRPPADADAARGQVGAAAPGGGALGPAAPAAGPRRPGSQHGADLAGAAEDQGGLRE